jgi:hypothetical protein
MKQLHRDLLIEDSENPQNVTWQIIFREFAIYFLVCVHALLNIHLPAACVVELSSLDF